MRLTLIFFILLTFFTNVRAQEPDTTKSERFTLHGQTTVISQTKPSFTARYSGPNSLSTAAETQVSMTSTLYAGARLWKGASAFINPEIAGGSGLTSALGIGAATNGETFRVGSPAPKIYVARIYFSQYFNLGKETESQETDYNTIAGKIPLHYLKLTVGKIGIADIFDQNKFSHDARTHFMSWAFMSNGAWDYPANTRGYTPSIVIEYISKKIEVRYGISLMPLTANGNDMNWDVSKSNSNTLEVTRRYKIKGHEGAIRILGFYTMANMGNYKQSINDELTGSDITLTRKPGRTKYGFGINAEQDFTKNFGAFFRASWNDGNNETWAFTEIDRSMSLGLSLYGEKWKRKNDYIGLAYVVSGISKPHQDYLKAGGKGFMLGDGYLNYGSENLMEFFYCAELKKDHFFLSGAYQLLINPGYNKDRHGPVNIFSVRAHMKF